MHLSNDHIDVLINESLRQEDKETIFHLWNNGYPSELAYHDISGLESYLKGVDEALHYFLHHEGFYAWSMVFKRDGEYWFAIIVDAHIQKKGIGKSLLNFIKKEHPVLNGWVIESNAHQTKSGQPYISPLQFYVQDGFDVIQDVHLNLPQFSAVKITCRSEKPKYIFTTARLGLRNWQFADLTEMAKISADEEVMAFFPSTQNRNYVLDFIKRMKAEYSQKGFCYFAVDHLESGNMIGFIGMHEQTFEADFTPCIDIGWRLNKTFWNKGFATEGAVACLQYGFQDLKIDQIYSITPKVNIKSQRIMQKIGMEYVKDFEFVLLKDDERLKNTVLYLIEKEKF